MIQRSSLFTGLLVAAALTSAQATADSKDEEESAKTSREQAEIRYQSVSEAPLPRNRSEFGIGEQIYFWLERYDSPPGKRSSEFVVWTATDLSTVLPTITRRTDRTVVTVALAAADCEFSVGVVELDVKPSTDNRTARWQPTASANADRTQIADAEDIRWKAELYRLITLREGRKTSFEAVEREARTILAKPLTESDQALVYFHLAELYAQSGMIHPDRVLEYSRRALALPLDPIRRTTLSIYRGDARLAIPTDETFDERRRAAAIEYLHGLAEIAWHELPANPRPRKFMILYDGESPDEIKRVEEVRDFNVRVDFEATLIQHRRLIRQQLIAPGLSSW